jgi:hypothetical protein
MLAHSHRPMRAAVSAHSPGSHHLIGVLALAATITARVIATALPGALGGIERWIEGARLGAAILSQTLVVFGAAGAVGLLITTLWTRELPYFYRLYAFPATAVVLTLVALSVRIPLDTQEARLLGGVSTSLALAAGSVALPSSRQRAASLVLLATAFAGASHVAAHALASGPPSSSAVRFAQPLATLGHITDFGALTLAAAWIVSRSGPALRAALVGLALGSAVVAWGAGRGSADGAALWQVLASRSLSEMAPVPKPLLSDIGVYWVDACALGFSALLLLLSRAHGVLATAMCLALLVRADPDIPMCALMLVLAALLTALGDPGSRDPHPHPLESQTETTGAKLASGTGGRGLPETLSP